MKNGPTTGTRRGLRQADPEWIAIQALTFIAGDPGRADRFLALSGIGPGDLRHAASDPAFLLGVLDYVVAEEALLLDVAAAAGVSPEAVATAQAEMARR